MTREDSSIDKMLRDTLRLEVATATPCLDGLEDRIVAELGDRRPRLGFSGQLRQLVAPTRAGRWGQLAVIGTTAAVFLFVGSFIAGNVSFAPAWQQAEPSLAAHGGKEVLFVVPALNAKNVAVVGDFNAWEATSLADDNEDGIWTASIPLPPGRYEYAFVIDGRWWGQDPLADEYVRSFGQYSSVRYVGGGGDGV
jgi:hypothetical protein